MTNRTRPWAARAEIRAWWIRRRLAWWRWVAHAAGRRHDNAVADHCWHAATGGRR